MNLFVTANYRRSNGLPWEHGGYVASSHVASHPTLIGCKRAASKACIALSKRDDLCDIEVHVRDAEQESTPIFTYSAKPRTQSTVGYNDRGDPVRRAPLGRWQSEDEQ